MWTTRLVFAIKPAFFAEFIENPLNYLDHFREWPL